MGCCNSLKFPEIAKHYKSDICYATQNRQNIVKAMIPQITKLIVIGSKESSNSNRLCDIGNENNIPSFLVDRASNIALENFTESDIVGITAGASAPDNLVMEVIALFQEKFNATMEPSSANFEEDIVFHLPKSVRI